MTEEWFYEDENEGQLNFVIDEDMKQRILASAKRALENDHEDADCVDRTEIESEVLAGLLRIIGEQEPVKAKLALDRNQLFWSCESCGASVAYGDRFCRMCGRELKWK